MRNVLLCPPDYFQVIDVKNPFMEGAPAVDSKKARAQWENLRQAFADSGFGVYQIPPVPGLEDMVFAANQSFVGVTPHGRKFVVPSAMRFESRRLEVPHFTAYFRERGFEIFDLGLRVEAGEFLEGHGDLLWNMDHRFVWAGHGFRSSAKGIARFSAKMAEVGIEVVPLELRDPRFYHLDTCFAPLTPDAVLIYSGAFSPASLATLRERIRTVYEVEEAEALSFVCNGVVANGRFITPRLTPTLERALTAEQITPVIVDTSEFEKSGGSVYCMKVFIP